ncbi:hypothetical protein QSV34_10935 [Porticoccus sp. W117]|uniref:hypothetical protein n=1 Tax=Porticoccus sp. W117 TaxID=3054777 RepID=UPI002593A277|nr:hypothetical protein [Porticoccus sp. W117]MDM3871865.1 hypothetical protein [Porticoccus sp. W117]
MKILTQITGFSGAVVLCSLLVAPLTFANNDDTPLGRYLDCLNQQTKDSGGENDDRIANADRVLKACSIQRQAVLDSMPKEAALKQLRAIEYHLKGRESAESENDKG